MTPSIQIAQVDAQFVLGSRRWVGVEVPPHCSALGRFFMPAARCPCRPGASPRHRVPRAAEALDRAGHGIRRTGVATTVDEVEIGLAGIAVPVLDAAGRPGRHCSACRSR